MKIRFARSRDKFQVLSLLNELGEIINQEVIYNPENTKAHILGSQNYDDVMKSKTTRLFVIEYQSIIIGVASYFILTDFITGSQFAHIDDFIISKKVRGKGYGTKFMKGILRYSKKKHISPVKLTTSIQLTKAHHFYEKLGGKFTQKVIKFTV